jgi:hypothetical protein
LALSCSARASLRYRIARALLMASQIPTQQNEDSSTGKKIWFGAVRWHAVRQKGSPGNPFSPQFTDSPAGFLESCRGYPALRAEAQVQARNREARAALLG